MPHTKIFRCWIPLFYNFVIIRKISIADLPYRQRKQLPRAVNFTRVGSKQLFSLTGTLILHQVNFKNALLFFIFMNKYFFLFKETRQSIFEDFYISFLFPHKKIKASTEIIFCATRGKSIFSECEVWWPRKKRVTITRVKSILFPSCKRIFFY